MSPPHGFQWCPIGPLLVFLEVGVLNPPVLKVQLYIVQAPGIQGVVTEIPTIWAAMGLSHNFLSHSFVQRNFCPDANQSFTSIRPGISSFLLCCLHFLKFCFGGLSCGESVLRHITLFFRSSQHSIMPFQSTLVKLVNTFCLSQPSIFKFLLLITL